MNLYLQTLTSHSSSSTTFLWMHPLKTARTFSRCPSMAPVLSRCSEMSPVSVVRIWSEREAMTGVAAEFGAINSSNFGKIRSIIAGACLPLMSVENSLKRSAKMLRWLFLWLRFILKGFDFKFYMYLCLSNDLSFSITTVTYWKVNTFFGIRPKKSPKISNCLDKDSIERNCPVRTIFGKIDLLERSPTEHIRLEVQGGGYNIEVLWG